MDSSKGFPVSGAQPPQVRYNVELCDSDCNTILFLSGVTILKVSAMLEVMSKDQQVVITLYSPE